MRLRDRSAAGSSAASYAGTRRAALNLAAWRFYAGSGRWSAVQADAQELLVSTPSNSSGIYYKMYLGEWMAVYLHQLDQRAYFRVAKQPTGPWSDEVFMFKGETPMELDASNLDYALRAHPLLSPDRGRTMFFHYAHDTTAPAAPSVKAKDLPFEQVTFERQ